jgi:hypothetical protein
VRRRWSTGQQKMQNVIFWGNSNYYIFLPFLDLEFFEMLKWRILWSILSKLKWRNFKYHLKIKNLNRTNVRHWLIRWRWSFMHKLLGSSRDAVATTNQYTKTTQPKDSTSLQKNLKTLDIKNYFFIYPTFYQFIENIYIFFCGGRGSNPDLAYIMHYLYQPS